MKEQMVYVLLVLKRELEHRRALVKELNTQSSMVRKPYDEVGFWQPKPNIYNQCWDH
jgi:hypothetical protein